MGLYEGDTMTSRIPWLIFFVLAGCTAAQIGVINHVADGLDSTAPALMAVNPLVGIGCNVGALILRLVAAALPLDKEIPNGNPA